MSAPPRDAWVDSLPAYVREAAEEYHRDRLTGGTALLARAKHAAGPTARPTPQSTIEAIMYAVREHGLCALDDPASQQRLLACDASARTQINERIKKLVAASRLPNEEKIDA
jgi:hypothetical protein